MHTGALPTLSLAHASGHREELPSVRDAQRLLSRLGRVPAQIRGAGALGRVDGSAPPSGAVVWGKKRPGPTPSISGPDPGRSPTCVAFVSCAAARSLGTREFDPVDARDHELPPGVNLRGCHADARLSRSA